MEKLSYYLIYSSNIPNVPAIFLDDDQNEINLRRVKEPLESFDATVKIKYSEPYPKNPIMPDFLQDGVISVFSKKIHECLAPLKIVGVQLMPAEIEDPRNNKIYGDYYYLHIYNYLNCLDRGSSVCETNPRSGRVLSISKMVLDKNILSEIPLEDRLIFRLGEMSAFQLFHESIVNTIMETNPEGLRFVKVEDYHFGSAFD